MYAYCVIEYPIKSLDKAFTYEIPSNLQDTIKVGMKVLVPFNKSLIHAVVLKITNEYHEKRELKKIARIEDPFLVLNKELLNLGLYLKRITLCNLIMAYQTMLPSALKIKDQKSNYAYYEKYIVLKENNLKVQEYIETHHSKASQILSRLIEEKRILKSEFESTPVKTLEKLGFITIEMVQKYRLNNTSKEVIHKELNPDQQKVFTTIKNSFNQKQTFLLYGITGSGKTLVYLNLIKEIIKEGKTALLLVPEISLTEQIIKIFYDYFGENVAILHSGLSKAEKYDEYLKILKGEVKIVIGTRSAIFAPLTNIGLIIIDEEHSETFKQDTTPRYNALDIAKWRSKYHNCPLLLGSATPSFEAMARAQKNVYQLLTLKNRANNALVPEIEIVDMQEELAKRHFIISESLDKHIKKALANCEQIILLLNRRGYSTIITCSNCGYTYKCPHCDISLIYHKNSNSLRCHYCGYTTLKHNVCPKCQEKALNYLGMGTEKLEDILHQKYPEAKITRMDHDTTRKKGSYEQIIKSFTNHESDILLGTQMISKGLDFPECTVVGIINADTSLNIPDFRSSERTFQLLMQASGRSGRAQKKGVVIIQTFNPHNNTIKWVQKQDYLGFYKEQMPIRQLLKYPPYYYLVNIKVCSKDYTLASLNATKVARYLKSKLKDEIIILGPTTAYNFRIKNIYRFSITIKYQKCPNLETTLKELEQIFASNKEAYIEIDLNPLN